MHVGRRTARLLLRLLEPARVTALLDGRAYFPQLAAMDGARFRGPRHRYR